MSAVSNTLLLAGGGYTIDRSIRLRSSASSYLNRTPSVAGNRKTWTWSGWVKRGKLGSNYSLLSFGSAVSSWGSISFSGSNTLNWTNTANNNVVGTTAVYRDTSAWYHIVIAIDTTQATQQNRIKFYINGEFVTTSAVAGSYPSQNSDTLANTTTQHRIGSMFDGATNYYLDGYITEVNFIDGQALTPDSFGEYDSITGVWKPAKYTGTYGTNGFYLNFSDNTTTTTLAEDKSGQGNNWTANNISLTSGVTYDSMTDTPTIYAGGGNYCVWNAVAQSTVVNGTVTRSNGNLTSADGGTTYGLASFGTMGVTTGKWYWEVTMTSAGGLYANIGVVDLNSPLGAGTHTGYVYAQNGTKNTSFASGGGGSSYGSSYTTGDIIGVALNSTTSEITFYKNGASQGVAYTGISGNYTPAVGDGQNATSYTFDLNCGQRPFAYTPPDGFKELHTGNLPEPEIVDGSQYFNTVLYTGDATTSNAITGVGFQPDLVWIKNRASATSHSLVDSVRGVKKVIFTNSTTSEASYADGQSLDSFDADGFTVGSFSAFNGSSNAMVAWNWKANGAGVSNTDGSINSTVSANTTAGFSIVTYTGTGSAATVGHGLGVAPEMVICKNRDASPKDWRSYHTSLGNAQAVNLNQTLASFASTTSWNSTTPTSVVFSIGTASTVNDSGNNHIAYCFHSVDGYSKIGSYTGNGSADGPFVFTNFRPAFVMWKRTDTTGDWVIQDTTRGPYNQTPNYLIANSSGAEGAPPLLDINANGFKIRINDVGTNASGGTYIYMAFAENPFKHALAR